ncbi:MAG: AMMECR1 domain-containing protein [Thermofilum sp. ex4484_79]|nr:MAG: AMMECR1 domain-containing protein [Thermofilum sp. ex4484_79]
MRLTKGEGEFLVKLARRAVKEYLTNFIKIDAPSQVSEKLKEKRGVFVTIEKIVKDVEGVWRRELRGCIGFPEPVYPLVEATIEAAISAATEDPRFPPMLPEELKNVMFEVSVLTKPQQVEYETPEELVNMIKVGRDGLIIEKGMFRGLLLPQVPVEYGWDVEEFLSHACFKAGLPPNSWKYSSVKVFVFQAQIFAEIFPEGEIIERILNLGVKEDE